MLKEIQKEVYSDNHRDAIDGDIESAKNLGHCREGVLSIMTSFLAGGAQKADKVHKAQDIVDQAKKLMGDNVKKMIDS